MAIVDLTADTFDEFLESPDQYVVVDFWAEWCRPCKMMLPILQQLSEEYDGRVYFGKVDVDSNPELAERFKIQSVPTLKLFLNGEEVRGIEGAAPKGVLVKEFGLDA